MPDLRLRTHTDRKYSTGVKSEKGHTMGWTASGVLFGAVPMNKQADKFTFRVG